MEPKGSGARLREPLRRLNQLDLRPHSRGLGEPRVEGHERRFGLLGEGDVELVVEADVLAQIPGPLGEEVVGGPLCLISIRSTTTASTRKEAQSQPGLDVRWRRDDSACSPSVRYSTRTEASSTLINRRDFLAGS